MNLIIPTIGQTSKAEIFTLLPAKLWLFDTLELELFIAYTSANWMVTGRALDIPYFRK
jgi:hypothetical protein